MWRIVWGCLAVALWGAAVGMMLFATPQGREESIDSECPPLIEYPTAFERTSYQYRDDCRMARADVLAGAFYPLAASVPCWALWANARRRADH